MVLLLAFHILGAVVWVGGMFFAYLALRPAAGALDPKLRLPLWRSALERFLAWVWASVAALLATGYAMLFWRFGGFGAAGLYIHVMQGIGIVMVLIFLHLFFAPWRRFRAALDTGDLAAAARNLDQIRLMVGVNLILGLVNVIVGATGRYWSS